MEGARVPIATIDEDCNPLLREHDIGMHDRPVGETNGVVLSESESIPMQQRSDFDFRLCVHATVRAHPFRGGHARRCWIGEARLSSWGFYRWLRCDTLHAPSSAEIVRLGKRAQWSDTWHCYGRLVMTVIGHALSARPAP